MKPNELRGQALAAFETWRALGLTERQALDEVIATGLTGQPDGFDTMLGLGRAAGLTEAESRTFAVGRSGGEAEERAEWAEAAQGPAGAGRSVLSESEQASLNDQLRRAFAMAVSNAQTFGKMTEAQAVRHVAHEATLRVYEIARTLCAAPASGQGGGR